MIIVMSKVMRAVPKLPFHLRGPESAVSKVVVCKSGDRSGMPFRFSGVEAELQHKKHLKYENKKH